MRKEYFLSPFRKKHLPYKEHFSVVRRNYKNENCFIFPNKE